MKNLQQNIQATQEELSRVEIKLKAAGKKYREIEKQKFAAKARLERLQHIARLEPLINQPVKAWDHSRNRLLDATLLECRRTRAIILLDGGRWYWDMEDAYDAGHVWRDRALYDGNGKYVFGAPFSL